MTSTAPKTEKLSGTRPEGAHDEREAALRVQQLFRDIAPRYDFLNHFLSFSLDRLWRRRTARCFRRILSRADAKILDLCCGTGDLAFALDRARVRALGPAASRRAPLIGSDFVEAMVERARQKGIESRRSVRFAAADALELPFADAGFDLLTTAFGFRNLSNYERGLREFARVLKKGGEAGILEFNEPARGPLAGSFRFYFRHILPRVGGAISGNREAYAYLPNSVAKFPSPPELAAMMQRCGFRDVRQVFWNFGSVVLHTGVRE